MTHQIPSWHRRLTALAILLSATAGTPAFAAGSAVNDEPSTTVKLNDLDLNTESGRQAALDRLSEAAYRVCAEQAHSYASVGYPKMLRACYEGTLATVVKRVHHKQLSALFAARSHTRAG